MHRIGAIILAVLSLPIIFGADFYQVIKLRTFDALVVTPEPSGLFTILNITEQDVDNEGGYPLPRQRLAEIQRELLERGAIGVGWGIGFPHADRQGGDQAFAEILGVAPSVLPLFENPNGEYPATEGTVILGTGEAGGYMASGVIENIPVLAGAAAQGIATAPVEVDNLVRRIPLLYRTPDGWLAAFGTQVLKVIAQADTYMIRTNDNGIEEIAVQGLPPVPVDSQGRKWISWIVPRETSLSEMEVQDTFVIVGVTAEGVMPQLATPVGLLEPHYVQASLAESMLRPDSPYIPDWAIAAEVAIYALTVALIWALTSLLGITWGITLAGLVVALTAVSGAYLIQRGILIDVSWSLISQVLAAGVAFYLNFRTQFKLRQQIKEQFEHYLDPRQVKKLQDNPDLLVLGGEKRYATWIFTDVRGFTSMSEQLPAEKVTYIMNRALTVQQACVQKHGGMVDKYIGDALMGAFSIPIEMEHHEEAAVACAREMIEDMKVLNEELKAEGCPSITIGIGLSSGWAIVGNMGSEQRFDFTAIGDAVNCGSRLESSTKSLDLDCLISEATAKACRFDLRYIKDIQVKGKSESLKVYGL